MLSLLGLSYIAVHSGSNCHARVLTELSLFIAYQCLSSIFGDAADVCWMQDLLVYYLRDHGEHSALIGALPRCEFFDCRNGAYMMASVESTLR